MTGELGIMVVILVPLGFFALIFLTVYFTSKFKHQTQKAIIEKGGNIEFPQKKMRYLEIALMLIGFGLGLAISSLFQGSNLLEDAKGMLVGASVFIFSGAGLVTAILIRRKIEQDENK